MGSDGVTRLIDFGTSRAPGENIGEAGLRCKPRYASPEMMSGGAVWPESDIFSMGAVLFQLLSKQPAFSADPRRRKKESLVPNPSMLNRRAPTPFDPICQRALDPDSDGRFHSAREMLEALDQAVEESGIELRRLRVSFWVRRVIQSRHGDVEFDINELEELLDGKRAGQRTSARASSNQSSNSAPATPTTAPRDWTIPPPTVTVRRPNEPGAASSSSSSDEYAAVPSSERLGAAARYDDGATESNLSLRARLWLTGVITAIVVFVALFAVFQPDKFKSLFTLHTGEAFPPAPPSVGQPDTDTPRPAVERPPVEAQAEPEPTDEQEGKPDQATAEPLPVTPETETPTPQTAPPRPTPAKTPAKETSKDIAPTPTAPPPQAVPPKPAPSAQFPKQKANAKPSPAPVPVSPAPATTKATPGADSSQPKAATPPPPSVEARTAPAPAPPATPGPAIPRTEQRTQRGRPTAPVQP